MYTGFQQFGFRVLRAGLFSLALFLVYWVLFLDTYPRWIAGDPAEEVRAAFVGAVSWGVFWAGIYSLGKILDFQLSRSIFIYNYFESFKIFIFIIVALFFIGYLWSGYFYALEPFRIALSPDMREYIPDYILYYIRNLVIPIALLVGPVYLTYKLEELAENPLFRELFAFGQGGSARLAGIAAYKKNYFFFSDCTRSYGERKAYQGSLSDRIYLGRTLFHDSFIPRYVGVLDDAHMLTIGSTGSGKSTTALWPNLMTYEGSAFVIDPKGEHARRTLGRRQTVIGWDNDTTVQNGMSAVRGIDTRNITKTERKMGNHCWLLDPFGEVAEYPTSPYNPLSEIDITSKNVRGLISAISDACVLIEGKDNVHFVETAKTVLEGLIAHVLSQHPKKDQNLPFIYDLFLGILNKLIIDIF